MATDPEPPDPEIAALAKVAEALDGLDLETCARVLRWAQARFVGISAVPAPQVLPTTTWNNPPVYVPPIVPSYDPDLCHGMER